MRCGGRSAGGSARGRGFWGVPASPEEEEGEEDEERSCRGPGREALPGATCIGSMKTRAVITASGPGWRQGAPEARGVPREARLPSLLPCHLPRLLGTEPPARWPSPPGLRAMAGSPRREVGEFTHGARLRTRGHRTKEEPPLPFGNLSPAGGCSPSGGGAGEGSVRSTSRRTRPASPRSTGTGGSSPRG